MASLGTETDQLSERRRAYFHHFCFPVRRTTLPLTIIPAQHQEDGGYAVDSCLRVEWNFFGWNTPSGPLIGEAVGRIECRKHPFGDWICPRGNRHSIRSAIGSETTVGVYTSGQEVPLTRVGYRDLFRPPPFCPALQTALLIGQASYQDYVVLPTVRNMNPVTWDAQKWIETAPTVVRDAYLKGLETVYYQTGVCLQGTVAEVDNVQLLALMRELGVPLPEGVSSAEFLSYVDQIKDESSRLREGSPYLISAVGAPRMKIKESLTEKSSPHPLNLPKMDIRMETGIQCVSDLSLAPTHFVDVPRGLETSFLGWSDTSTSVREWMTLVRSSTKRTGGVIGFVRLPSMVVSTDVHVWEKDEGPDVQYEKRARANYFPALLGTGNASVERFVNGEAIRMLHAGVRFPRTCPGLVQTLPVVRRSPNENAWSRLHWPVMFSDEHGAPSLRDGKVVAHPRYRAMNPLDCLTLVFERSPFSFPPGSRMSPGSVFFLVSERKVLGDTWRGKVNYPRITHVTDAIAIDPEGCELRDDAFRIQRSGDQFTVDVYTLSVASHLDLRFTAPSLPLRTRYISGEIHLMLPNLAIGLAKGRSSFCHHHRIVVSPSDYAYSYQGLTSVKLRHAYSYQEALARKDRPSLRHLIDVAHLLFRRRDGLRSGLERHTEWVRLLGRETHAVGNLMHEGIQELSIAVGIAMGGRLPIRVATSKRSLPPYVRAIEDKVTRACGDSWRREMGTLPFHWRAVLRAVYIRNGGSKRYTDQDDPHVHIDSRGPYASVTSPGRRKDCLLNDMFLCGQISKEYATAHIEQLNDGIADERKDRIQTEKDRIGGKMPPNPYVVVDIGLDREPTLFSVPMLADVKLPVATVTYGKGKLGINFLLSGSKMAVCWVGVGDVIFISGIVDDGIIPRISYVRKLLDSREAC